LGREAAIVPSSQLGKPDWDLLLEQQVHVNGRLFFRLAYNILRNAAEAEDACQMAFAKAWSSQESIRDAAALKGWLLSAVTNEALQLARRRKTEQRVLSDRPVQPAEAGAQGEQLALRESVEKALMGLPPATRLVVVLRLMQGMSGNEVAGIIGYSPSEVLRRLYDGVERLRKTLAEWQVAMEGDTHAV
jgi:RNA polymerase sigma-70 factor (ECF subfamily)